MNLETYPIKSKFKKTRFEFYSLGPKGRIKKVALFQKHGGNYYNLSFGDWDKSVNKIDYTTRSNNNDRDKVLATVALIVAEFMKHKPGSIVFAKGEIPGKTRLYQMAINRHLQEISYSYKIDGFYKYIWEPFRPGRHYEMFALKNHDKN